MKLKYKSSMFSNLRHFVENAKHFPVLNVAHSKIPLNHRQKRKFLSIFMLNRQLKKVLWFYMPSNQSSESNISCFVFWMLSTTDFSLSHLAKISFRCYRHCLNFYLLSSQSKSAINLVFLYPILHSKCHFCMQF